MENLQDYEPRANIMWAGMIAHNNIAGVGIKQDWATHDMEHELSAFYDCAHGAGLAVLSPAWMKYVYKQDVMRFVTVCSPCMGMQYGFCRSGENRIRRNCKMGAFLTMNRNAICNLQTFGAGEEDIPNMVEHLSKRGGIGRFVRILHKEAEDIFPISSKIKGKLFLCFIDRTKKE